MNNIELYDRVVKIKKADEATGFALAKCVKSDDTGFFAKDMCVVALDGLNDRVIRAFVSKKAKKVDISNPETMAEIVIKFISGLDGFKGNYTDVNSHMLSFLSSLLAYAPKQLQENYPEVLHKCFLDFVERDATRSISEIAQEYDTSDSYVGFANKKIVETSKQFFDTCTLDYFKERIAHKIEEKQIKEKKSEKSVQRQNANEEQIKAMQKDAIDALKELRSNASSVSTEEQNIVAPKRRK